MAKDPKTPATSSTLSRIKLVVSDVDGTLVTSNGNLTTDAIEAAGRLEIAGIRLALVSDRPPRGLAMLTGPLGLDTPVAAFDGAMILTPDLATVLEQHTLPTAVLVEAVDLLRRAGVDIWVYRGTDWFVSDLHGPRIAEEQRLVQFAPTRVSDFASVLDGAVKLVGVSDDDAKVKRCEAELRGLLGDDAVVACSKRHFVDVVPPDVHKGTALRTIAVRLGVPLDHVAAVGDAPIDVLMFALAGTSIAMGNASPDVRRCARWVTLANDDGGFADAVNHVVLHEGASEPTKLGLPSHTAACLFDLDGVLTQTAKVHAAAWKQAFDEYLKTLAERSGEPLVPFDAVEDYDKYVDGKPRIDGTRSFLASRSIRLPEGTEDDPPSAETVHGLSNRKNELVLQLLEHGHVNAYPGSLRYLHAVREAGIPTAVVSSSKNCKQVLASAGISDLFDVCIDGNVAEETHLAGKPAPDTFLAAARALTVDPAHAVVFEDALAGVGAGRAGHFGYVVGVDRVGQAADLIRHGADVVVGDLGALLEAP
nr:beta-phosphoglucomutase family hydrolase [Labilithrix luteola]